MMIWCKKIMGGKDYEVYEKKLICGMRFVPVKSSGVACSNSGIWRKTGQTGRMYTDYGSGDTGTGTSVLTVLYLV